MQEAPIDPRKAMILRAVVLDYVATGEPVASRTIARKYRLGVSPATIRNEMADLEEMGYLEQPHTSAGRIPSDRGYRYFVDWLMDPAYPPREEVHHLRQALARRLGEIGALIRQTAQILAETTRCLALVEGPRLDRAVLHALQVVPLRGRRAVLVLITDEGLVENRLLELPYEVEGEDLERVVRTLNHYLHGLPLGGIGRGVLQRLQGELAEYRELVDRMLALLSEEPSGTDPDDFVCEGTTQIFVHPEFRDLRRLQALLEAVSRRDLLERLLGDPGDPGRVRVTIGTEHAAPEARDWSTVTATYLLGGRIAGRVAVIGPKRMDYGRVWGWVEVATQSLNDFLARSI